MNGKIKSKWIYGSTAEGSYIACSNCNGKLSAKTVLFADKPYNVCPKCKRKMADIDDEIIEKLRVSIL